MTMKGSPLPNDKRVEQAKVTQYLLHPVNSRGKSAFFERMGFALASWEELRDALREHAVAAPDIEVVATPYGVRYIVEGPMATPSRRQPSPIVTAVWQHDLGAEHVRFITAYPAKESK